MKYFIIVLQTLLLVIFILVTVALFTLFERKIMANIQKRKGPNVVGFLGILQPFADGLKLLIKETILPSRANKTLFIIAPISSLFLSLITWSVIPFGAYNVFANLNFSILYIFAVSSLNVYSIIFAGWSGNSKYSFLGTLRSAAQMISYEVSIGLIIICVLISSNTLNFLKLIEAQTYIWYIIPLFPLFLLFYISVLAETNRPPFDLPEAEAELVAGYFVEYSAMTFAQFFLGENINIIMVCVLVVIFFLGGWNFYYPYINFMFPNISKLIYIIKIIFFLFSFVWVRVTFPRYRYDQLMRLGWKIFLPLTLALALFISSIMLSFNLLT